MKKRKTIETGVMLKRSHTHKRALQSREKIHVFVRPRVKTASTRILPEGERGSHRIESTPYNPGIFSRYGKIVTISQRPK